MKRAAAALIAVIITISVVTLWAGGLLVAPAMSTVGQPPDDLGVEAVTFPSKFSSTIHGWFVRGHDGWPVIVLMHGVRANRLSMMSRARFLAAAGYSVLAFDFQAHGESPGAHITFGHREAYDAEAAVKFVRGLMPSARVGAIGSSQGGAAALVGPRPLEVDALVLEAVYATLEEAVADRLVLRFGSLGRYAAPLLTLQIKPRLGFDPAELRPIRGIAAVRCPVLLIAGSEDTRTPLAESKRMFDMAPQPKELWVVTGAGHVNFHRFAGSQYEERVLSFFSRSLKVGGG